MWLHLGEETRLVTFIETERRVEVARGCEGRDGTIRWYRVLVWEEWKVLEVDGGDICTIMCMYLTPRYCTHQIILCMSYHNLNIHI